MTEFGDRRDRVWGIVTEFVHSDKSVTEFGDCDRVWGIVTEFVHSDQSVTEFVL